MHMSIFKSKKEKHLEHSNEIDNLHHIQSSNKHKFLCKYLFVQHRHGICDKIGKKNC